ncbi:MAG: fibronectin type III domain-containing protein [Bacteroidia bacterium]
MRTKYLICLTILYFLFTSAIVAQRNNKNKELPKLALINRNGTDSIILRWVIEDRQLFLKGIENGYRILRADFDGTRTGKYTEVSIVKPWSKDKWQKALKSFKDTTEKSYKYLNLGYELIYNNQKYLPKGLSNMEEIIAAKSQNELTYLFIIIGSCMDNQTAEAMGLRWVDKNITKGYKYKYKIEPANIAKNQEFQGSEVVAEASMFNRDINSLISPIENEKSIILNWKFPNEPFIGYSLERSKNKGLTYQRLNKDLILLNDNIDSNQQNSGVIIDTTVVMYEPYVYRLIGHSLFGDEVTIGNCNAMAKDRTPVTCIFVPNPESTAGKKAILKWDLNCIPADLLGFAIRRSTNINGPFTKLLTPRMLNPGARSFTDSLVDLNNENFYIVQTYDTAGNIFSSSPAYLLRTDTIPPDAPVWLSAKADSNGLVTLKLLPNSESDFMGFRIMQANQEDHEFTTIIENFSKDSSFKINRFDTCFHDTITLNSLTPYVYYRAFALDKNYNTSKSSKIIKVLRPDTIAPVTPVLRAVIPTDSCLILSIIPSSSKDVVGMHLYRMADKESKFEFIERLNPKDTIFYDKYLIQEETYYYSLVACDSFNNFSDFSFIQKGKTYDSGIRKGVSSLKAEYDSDSKEIVVSWDYNEIETSKEEIFFQVYCSIGVNPLERCEVIPYKKGIFMYSQIKPKPNEIYNYAVRVVTSKGAESPMSVTKSVKMLAK